MFSNYIAALFTGSPSKEQPITNFNCLLTASGEQEMYQAVEGDAIDTAIAKFLNQDPEGMKIVIPVIRFYTGNYMIGMLKYDLKVDENARGGLIGRHSGLPITDLIRKIQKKFINNMETYLSTIEEDDLYWP